MLNVDINVDRRTDGRTENRTPISHPATSRCDKNVFSKDVESKVVILFHKRVNVYYSNISLHYCCMIHIGNDYLSHVP